MAQKWTIHSLPLAICDVVGVAWQPTCCAVKNMEGGGNSRLGAPKPHSSWVPSPQNGRLVEEGFRSLVCHQHFCTWPL